MDFAVVKIAGKQHLVSVGDQIEVNADLGKIGDKVSLDEVLLLSQNDKVAIGTPLVGKTKVAAEVVFSGKGEKIRVAKFKAKARYRKVMGFRPLLTTLKILNVGDEEISIDSGKQSRPSKRGTKKSSKV